MITVNLDYFKPSGKWYSSGDYGTEKTAMHEIFDEVQEMRDSGNLPGLVKGHSKFIVSVHVQDDSISFPGLII